MQNPAQPAPPALPAPPTLPPGATFTLIGPQGTPEVLMIPQTRAEVRALLSRRESLSDQLSSVADRRHQLAMELEETPEGAARAGIEARIGLLDNRILQLETDLARTGRELSAASPGDGRYHGRRDEPAPRRQFRRGIGGRRSLRAARVRNPVLLRAPALEAGAAIGPRHHERGLRTTGTARARHGSDCDRDRARVRRPAVRHQASLRIGAALSGGRPPTNPCSLDK